MDAQVGDASGCEQELHAASPVKCHGWMCVRTEDQYRTHRCGQATLTRQHSADMGRYDAAGKMMHWESGDHPPHGAACARQRSAVRTAQFLGTGTSLTGVRVDVHRLKPGHRNLWTAF